MRADARVAWLAVQFSCTAGTRTMLAAPFCTTVTRTMLAAPFCTTVTRTMLAGECPLFSAWRRSEDGAPATHIRYAVKVQFC